MTNNICVYKHIRPDKNEVFYVGIGKISRAKSVYCRNKYWKNIVKSCNKEFRVEIMYQNLSWEDACKKEKELIFLYGRKDLNKGTLCNMTDGGDGIVGLTHSKEVREQIGLAKKLYHKKNTHFNKGKNPIYSNSVIINLIHIKTFKFYSFESFVTAGKFINQNPQRLRRAAVDGLKTIGNYYPTFIFNITDAFLKWLKDSIDSRLIIDVKKRHKRLVTKETRNKMSMIMKKRWKEGDLRKDYDSSVCC